MTVLVVAACLCITSAVSSCEPSDTEIRQFLSNTAYLTQEWRASFDAMSERFPSKRRFAERIVDFLHDEDADVRRGVLFALVKLKTKDTAFIPAVARVLQEDSDPWVRVRAVGTLHSIAGKDSVNCLSPALDDQDANVRAAAIRVLGAETASSTASIGKLRDLLSDTGEYYYAISADCIGARPVKYDAVLALGEMGSKASVCLPQLKEMIANDADPEVRVAAAVAVAQLDKEDESVIRYLIDEAQHASSECIRSDAIQGLNRLGSRASASAPVLKNLLSSDRSWLVRSDCAIALPAVQGANEGTVNALVGALGDREPRVQMTALESLEAMGAHAAGAVPAVERLLDKCPRLPEEDLPHLNGDIRVQAVVTLFAIGKREDVVPIVRRMLDSVKDEELQTRIRGLLSQHAESPPVPNKEPAPGTDLQP